MDWETPKVCNFCGGTTARLYMKERIGNWYGSRPLRLLECRTCGLVYASPRPVFHEHYPGQLAGGSSAEEAFDTKLNRKNVNKIHERHVTSAVERLGRPARSLFDMAFGAGTLLMIARNMGLDVSGNEINGYAVESLRSLGFDVVHARTRDLVVERRFDIVMALDSLEHSYEPFDELKIAHDLLEPDGILYLKTLYLNSEEHRKLGPEWRLFGAGHFHFFAPEVLLNMVRKAGFDIEHVETTNLIFVTARKVTPAAKSSPPADQASPAAG